MEFLRQVSRLSWGCGSHAVVVQESTLFRGATATTKSMSIFAQEIGEDYLKGSIGRLLNYIVDQSVDLEVRSHRMQGNHVESRLRDSGGGNADVM